MTLSHTMVGPKLDSTRRTSSAMPSRLVTAASRTPSPWSARTPVTRLNRPWRSPATTVMRSPSPWITWRPPPQQLEVLRGGEVLPDLFGAAAAEDVGDPTHQVAHEVGLPLAPRRRAGGEAVGFGEAGQEPEREQVADGFGDALDGGRVVEVATRGDVGQEQVVAHHGLEHRDVLGREPHPRADRVEQVDADVGVVAGVALADVVEERAEHQQIRAVGAGDQRGRVRRRLHQVPVDREAVVGVPLRLAPDRLPLGEDVHPEAQLVERLDHGDGAVAREQEVDEGGTDLRRPGVRQVPGSGRQALERRPVDAGVAGRGGGGGSEHQARVDGGVGVRGEVHFAIAQHEPRSDRLVPP